MFTSVLNKMNKAKKKTTFSKEKKKSSRKNILTQNVGYIKKIIFSVA